MSVDHTPTPDPPFPSEEPPPAPVETPRPIDDPKPAIDPPVRDPSPDERPNPKRYQRLEADQARGAIMSAGITHASYCASLT